MVGGRPPAPWLVVTRTGYRAPDLVPMRRGQPGSARGDRFSPSADNVAPAEGDCTATGSTSLQALRGRAPAMASHYDASGSMSPLARDRRSLRGSALPAYSISVCSSVLLFGIESAGADEAPVGT